jgi:hypothetical protein
MMSDPARGTGGDKNKKKIRKKIREEKGIREYRENRGVSINDTFEESNEEVKKTTG